MQIKNLNENYRITSDSPSFKAKIRFVNEKYFNSLRKKLLQPYEVGKITNEDWLIEEAAVKKQSAFTLEACNCVVGSIFNPETKLVNMLHLSPYVENMSRINEVKDIIFEQAKNLKDKSKINLEGFITGGNSSKIRGSFYNVKLLEEILDTFRNIAKNLGMDYSVIAGRENGLSSVNVLSDATKNVHFVYVNTPREEIRNITNLMGAYERKLLSPKDTIILANQNVTKIFNNIIS